MVSPRDAESTCWTTSNKRLNCAATIEDHVFLRRLDPVVINQVDVDAVSNARLVLDSINASVG